jgi:hypothetical protein
MTGLWLVGAERDQYVAELRRSGHTLEQIAGTLGVSRERVRQLAKRAGAPRPAVAASGIDPVALLRFARSRECRSMRHCARHFGLPHRTVNIAFRELGVARALKRLYRWRRRSNLRARIIVALRAFAAKHGRAPTSEEMCDRKNGLPYPAEVARVFGGCATGFWAAGLEPRATGPLGHLHREPATHCRRGHPFTPENTYTGVRPSGKRYRLCKECQRFRDRRAREHAR